MLNAEITPYPEINTVLTELAKGINDTLGNKLVGIYLFGSLTYGDFNLETSDIDLTTIVKEPLTESEAKLIEQLHHQIDCLFPRWAKRIESSYTPQSMLHSIKPPLEPRPYYGESVFYPEAEYGNEWIINLYLLYHHGITIQGPDFKTFIPAIDIREVQQACVRDLYKEWEPKLRNPEWLDNSHYQSYLVLNLCRILNTVTNGTVLSKRKSALWVKQQYPEWAHLIETAESWKYDIEIHQKTTTLEFLRFIIEKNKI